MDNTAAGTVLSFVSEDVRKSVLRRDVLLPAGSRRHGAPVRVEMDGC